MRSHTSTTIVIMALWLVPATTAVLRILADPGGAVVGLAQYRSARSTAIIVTILASLAWVSAVLWWRRTAHAPPGAGRFVGLYLVLAAAVLASLPFVDERYRTQSGSVTITCPGAIASMRMMGTDRDPGTCADDGLARSAIAAVLLVAGATTLLITLRRRHAPEDA
jgi:hypothetical protein